MSNNPFEVQPRGRFYAPTGPVLMTVGDVAVTETEILLPFGRFPLSRSVWVVRDNTRSERRTAGWAIVFAIGGVLFLGWVFGLGLLFSSSWR